MFRYCLVFFTFSIVVCVDEEGSLKNNYSDEDLDKDDFSDTERPSKPSKPCTKAPILPVQKPAPIESNVGILISNFSI